MGLFLEEKFRGLKESKRGKVGRLGSAIHAAIGYRTEARNSWCRSNLEGFLCFHSVAFHSSTLFLINSPSVLGVVALCRGTKMQITVCFHCQCYYGAKCEYDYKNECNES